LFQNKADKKLNRRHITDILMIIFCVQHGYGAKGQFLEVPGVCPEKTSQTEVTTPPENAGGIQSQ